MKNWGRLHIASHRRPDTQHAAPGGRGYATRWGVYQSGFEGGKNTREGTLLAILLTKAELSGRIGESLRERNREWKGDMYFAWTKHHQYIAHLLHLVKNFVNWFFILMFCNIWRPPSLSELTPMLFNMGRTNLGSETFI